MLPDDPDFLPTGSFQWPIPAPTSDPDVGALVHIDFAAVYLPAVIGCLMQLLEQTTWDTTDPDVLNLAQSRADMLIQMFGGASAVYQPGMIMSFGGTSAPSGWLMCDGSAVSRTAYADLFAAIGTAFGPGDLLTTFNLPDLRGRVPVGVGQQLGGSAFTLAEAGGEESHTLTSGEMPSHGHSDIGHAHTVNYLATGLALEPGELPVAIPTPIPSLTGSANANITSTGGGGAHNNIQPYLALNAIIKS